MRDLDAALLAEQKKSEVTPYTRVHLEAAAGSPTYTFALNDSPNRLYSVFHREEPYGGIAIIQLKNPDSYFNSRNLRGHKVTIGWGLVTSAGNKYSSPADLWVLSQKEISEEGQLLTELACIDIWGLLARDEVYIGGTELKGTVTWKVTGADARTERITGGTSGAKAIIYEVYDDRIHVVQPEGLNGTFQVGETAESTSLKIVISAVGAIGEGGVAPPYDGTFSVFTIIQQMLTGFATLTLDSDDPEGNAQNYKPKYQIALGASVRSVIMDVLGFTKCGLRMKTDGMHMLYLDPSPASADYIFDSVHKFKSENRERAIVTPNRIFVTNTDEEGEVYVGYGVDTDSYNALGKWLSRIDVVPSVASNDDASARAVALIARAKAEANAGDVIVPIMNCGQEVYDWLSITDSRNNNIVITGRVGAVERRFAPGIYQMSARLGGLSTSADITPEGIPESDIQVEPTSPVDITIPKPGYWTIPAAIQGYHHDITFTAVNWNTVSWSAGTIKFYDGSTMSVNSGSHNLTSGLVHHIYFVKDDPVLKVTDNYLNVLAVNTGVLCLIQRGSDTTVKATVIPSYGKEPLITADVIYLTGLLDRLPNGTYAKTLSTVISAGRIKLDEVVTGTYGLVRQTQISAGNLKLTSASVKSGEWYNESGVEIDATHGINIYGTNQAFTTRATKYGTIQCYVGSDGKIYAGAGNVILDSTGLTIKGHFLRFYYGTTYVGYIKALSSSRLQIYCGTDIELYAGRIYLDAETRAEQSILPQYTNVYLGSSLNRFQRVYGCPILSSSLESIIEGALRMKGLGSGDIYIYSSGAWRTNT